MHKTQTFDMQSIGEGAQQVCYELFGVVIKSRTYHSGSY